MTRLAFLDSLRAIAITAVAGFHYFHLWSTAAGQPYPYGDRFADMPLFRFGNLGVQLFFLISGFVITLTLRDCRGLYEFTAKRFARLWPALVGATLILAAFVLVSGTPLFPRPRPADLLPSLTTVGPSLFRAVGIPSEYIIGSVWSLFVEIRFYLLAALLFFFGPRRFFVAILLGFAIVSMTLLVAHGRLDDPAGTLLTTTALPRHIGWFALGAYGYELHLRRQTALETGLALIVWAEIGILFWLFPEADAPGPSAAIALGLPLGFAAIVLSGPLQRCLAARPLARVGAASYSLYLLHEVLGVVAIGTIPKTLPLAAQLGSVAAIYGGLILLSLAFYNLVEAPGRTWLRALLLPARRRAAESFPPTVTM